MSANGQPCSTCGAMAQVEISRASGPSTYSCLAHTNVVGVETQQFALEAPPSDAPLDPNAGGPAPIYDSLGEV